ncbi:homoserine dehydrogenase [Martelella alba]|uniref:Homoserine dehydrogenase n=1 Tax=Martelella alba TaxID=2590451 RepID=A0A506UD98_9HYPH|nr:homoserine dehydrogenase [Martelella alba]TPW29717.1 homoserine dehydrogenase [Martelella alba]
MADALKIGVAGLGTVGAALVRIIHERQNSLAVACGRPITVVAVSARDRTKDRGADLTGMTWYDSAAEMARLADIDVLVELVGGASGIAREAVEAALERGLHVVTANKALLADCGVELASLAEDKGVLLNFEAAVAGGIPVIKAIRESLTGNNISRVYGIMNGTCNYILTRMEREGLSFDACLKEAQRLGYAEADPTFDIEGNDTAHKLAILTSLAFGCQISADDIYLEGISNITLEDIQAASELGYRIKLLGVAQRTEGGIEQRVHPTMVPHDTVIAQVDGVTNAVALESDVLGDLLMVGPGAGGNATASAVLGDIADIAKSRPGTQSVPALGRPARSLEPYRRARMRSHEGGYFIRLRVVDRIGVIAAIARQMAENQISLESIVQHSTNGDLDQPIKTIILVTHATTEQSVRQAVSAIEGEGYTVAQPQVIRIEKP